MAEPSANYAFRIVNVFTAGGALTGNPLCVFEDARGLDDKTLQGLALQFNLSETTFILPSGKAAARVRIFTPAYEMPFAGHPTLGTAFVVNALQQGKGEVTLEMKAGVIPVRRIDGGRERWQLKANVPTWHETGVAGPDLARMLGLNENDIGAMPRWMNAGKEQLVVPITSRAAVDRCGAGSIRLGALKSIDGQSMAYVFHDDGREVYARFFFPGNGAVLEDPATGSACANLGGWFLAQGAALPLSRTVSQGGHVGRPSKLYLNVDASGGVHVAGDVIELARGNVTL
jgi:trans-2,3-dihydro-3-hydroxyanthranilate isomerase